MNVAIVDDINSDRARLKTALSASSKDICRIQFECFESGDDLLKVISASEFDAVFLDICMEGTNGIDTAKQLRTIDPKLPIIFVTSSDEYVWHSFEIHPFDYLLKPFEHSRVEKLLNDLLLVTKQEEPELELRVMRRSVLLPFGKIVYVTSQNHSVNVMSDEGLYRSTNTFADIHSTLGDDPRFLLCNRGVIVNMDKVLKFENGDIQMQDGESFPVRQKDKARIFADFTQYKFRNMRDEF